ncbi:MAG TPA: OB-fold domain-containing protein, partial [Acidimicrobiales bacterium]
LPEPVTAADGLDAEFWAGLEHDELRVQECRTCGTRQFPEWICHRCLGFDLSWVPVRPTGTLYSWERVWNPSHPAVTALPYLVVLVQLDDAPEVRMIGNLLGDPHQTVVIDSPLEAAFEHHERFTLVQWRSAGLRTDPPG